MTAITFDEATLAKLKPLRGRVEVRDEAGRVIGFYHPAAPQGTATPKTPFSVEELQRRRAEPGGGALERSPQEAGSVNRYHVVWKPRAQDDLARLWMAASDRAGITATSEDIDRMLVWDPDQVGEQIFDTVRSVVVYPLGVDFEVVQADRLVSLGSVRAFGSNAPARGSLQAEAAVPAEGKLDFGSWEQISYGEFNGQRAKRVLVKVIGE